MSCLFIAKRPLGYTWRGSKSNHARQIDRASIQQTVRKNRTPNAPLESSSHKSKTLGGEDATLNDKNVHKKNISTTAARARDSRREPRTHKRCVRILGRSAGLGAMPEAAIRPWSSALKMSISCTHSLQASLQPCSTFHDLANYGLQ